MLGKWLLLLGLLFVGVQGAHAKAPPIWTGNSGGFRWVWSATDVTATPLGARKPTLSLKRLLKTEADQQASLSFERSVTVLSVVGPLISVRVEDFWTGGAHPSGWTWYQSFDARHPERTTTLTDYVPYVALRKPFFTDKVVGGILRKKGLREAPTTGAQFERVMKDEMFEVDEVEHRFGEHALREFSFHHIEGDQVAIRLNVSWGGEFYRFRTTEIGVLAPTPAVLRRRLEAAASRKEGFLRREGARSFRDKSSIIAEWSSK